MEGMEVVPSLLLDAHCRHNPAAGKPWLQQPEDAPAVAKPHPTPVWVPTPVRLRWVLFSQVSEPPSSCEFFCCWLKPPLLELTGVNRWSCSCAVLSFLLVQVAVVAAKVVWS
ncbi:uncharacterized protein LOC110264991 [Arachis ipaensis]|uniref:uncharacterized protein LOC110264991 n=1 Tax=Arachis ipaensis TaxID=130454 RepID=UPI000A2B3E06|nr:uncharacterized protein LOC110264991 [Arachis ipaensis]